MITYAEFKKKYPPGSTVSSPEGTYPGQCVSLCRTYMLQVDGFKSGPLGDAVDIPSNPTFLASYKEVPNSERKVGDLMFWGNDEGSWTGPPGHTAVYDGSDRMYNQNYNGSLVVSFNSIFTPGFIGYYRKKEDMLTNNQLVHLYRIYYGRAPLDKEREEFVDKVTFDALADKLRTSNAYKTRIGKAKAGTLAAKNHLPNEIRAVYVTPTPAEYVEVTETLYREK